MTDTSCREFHLESTWRSFGRSLAAGTGALAALLSLMSGAPLLTSCGRGALALLGVALLTRIGAAALTRTAQAVRPQPDDEEADTPLEDASTNAP